MNWGLAVFFDSHEVIGFVAVSFLDDIFPAGQMIEGGPRVSVDICIPSRGVTWLKLFDLNAHFLSYQDPREVGYATAWGRQDLISITEFGDSVRVFGAWLTGYTFILSTRNPIHSCLGSDRIHDGHR